MVAALNTPDAEGETFEVGPAETVIGSTNVGPGQQLLSIVTQWPGSDVTLALVSPSGVRYTRDDPGAGVVHDVGPTWEQYEITSPQQGAWRFELFGKDVNTGGEPVTVMATTEPFANVPPIAKVSYVENADGTLTFSSAQSSDPDGQIAVRQWYVSLGSDTEVRSEGETVTVPLDSGGKNITLVVTDDRGDSTFAELVVPKVERAPGGGPGIPADPPVTTPDDRPVAPVIDRTAPRITKLSLQRAVRRRGRTTWQVTRKFKGNVRLRLTLSEPATVTVKLSSARTPTKIRTRTVAAKRAGVKTLSVRMLAKGMRVGKVRLVVSAKDAAGNVSTRKLSVVKR